MEANELISILFKLVLAVAKRKIDHSARNKDGNYNTYAISQLKTAVIDVTLSCELLNIFKYLKKNSFGGRKIL